MIDYRDPEFRAYAYTAKAVSGFVLLLGLIALAVLYDDEWLLVAFAGSWATYDLVAAIYNIHKATS